MMRNWKKISALFLALTLLLSLCACTPAQEDLAKLTPKEHMVKLEIQELTAFLNSFSGTEGEAAPALSGMEAEMTVRVGDQLVQLLQQSVPDASVDLSFLDEISLGMVMNMKDTLAHYALELGVNGDNLVSADMFMDMASSVIWLGLPELCDTYAKLDMQAMNGAAGDTGAFASGMATPDTDQLAEIMEKLLKKLPEGKLIKEILLEYATAALNEIEDVDRSDKTLKVEGVQQDVVMLKTTVTEKDLAEIVETLLKKAKDDKRFEEIIDDLGEALKDLPAEAGVTLPDDLYKEFQDAIEDAIEEIEEQEDFNKKNRLIIKTYTDKNNAIVGRSISMESDGEEMFALDCLTATAGEDYGLELTVLVNGDQEVEVTLAGSTATKDNTTNGEFQLEATVDGTKQKILDIDVKDVTDKAGTVKLEPSAELLSSLMGGAAGFADLALEISWDDKGEVSLDVLMNDALLVGLDFTGKMTEAEEVKLPTNVTDCSDPMNMAAWAQSINVGKLMEKLTELGFPIPGVG